MRRVLIFTLLMLVGFVNVNAQRVSTQQFLVRKITFKTTDQIVPIDGVIVEINKAKFRSDKSGQFIANIPVTKDMGFYISNITAPGYIVSIPEDLSKKVFLSSNQFVIVLADINAVNAERTRIYNNNKAALAKQEERLKAEVLKNQELLGKIEKTESEYNAVLAELEKTKRQLESFNNAKGNLEERIDSLSENLSLLDYASLNSEECARIEKEKEGEWLGDIVDEVISKLETNLNAKHSNELIELEKKLKQISNEYYQAFIERNKPFAVNYFSYHYRGYLNDMLSDLRKKNDKVLDRILDIIIEEDKDDIITAHIDSCQRRWNVEESKSNVESIPSTTVKTLNSAKEEFMSWAWYPDREYSLQKVEKPKWYSEIDQVDIDILSTIKRVYSEFYHQCKKTSDKYVEQYMSLSNEDLYKYASLSEQARINVETENAIRQGVVGETACPYHEFVNIILFIATNESLEPLRIKYNRLIDEDIKNAENELFVSIDQKIRPISEVKHYTDMLSWESEKYINDYKDEYDNYNQEYPEYTSFLYPIVMQFMQPIINKYDCDDALYTWKSSMEEDVTRYCIDPIRNYSDKLSYIPNVAGSDDKCVDIVRTIIEIEKDKIVANHNEKIKSIKANEVKEELAAIAKMKKNIKKEFDNEEDIVVFLATHIFVNSDFEISSWYDSKISKWCHKMGQIESSEGISYAIIYWDKNSARIKINTLRGGVPIIVNIELNSSVATYSESCGGETMHFSVTSK